MSTKRNLWTCGALALVMATAANAQIVDLAPPGLTPYIGVDVGNAQIGTLFHANSTFTVDSLGIKFNPFGNITGQPKTAELDVYIYAVTPGPTRGALLASGSYCVGGPCPQATLLPSSGYPNGAPFFTDVPLNFTFISGQDYLVEFNVKPNGWGYGLTAKNFVEFFHFDKYLPNAPPYESHTPFTVGPVTVSDGAFNGDFYNQNLAHIRFHETTGGCVGGPVTLDLMPPGLAPYVGIDVGQVPGVSFTANTTFTIQSASIKFNPFINTGTPGPNSLTELDVFIYTVSGGIRGPQVATASVCVGGACPQAGLLPNNGTPGTPAFLIDVPITFTFNAGTTYLVEFAPPNGWGSLGSTPKVVMEFFHFDPTDANAPPNTSGVPFVVGPTTVRDGWNGGDSADKNFAHIRLITPCVSL